jgi:hypothetical protein
LSAAFALLPSISVGCFCFAAFFYCRLILLCCLLLLSAAFALLPSIVGCLCFAALYCRLLLLCCLLLSAAFALLPSLRLISCQIPHTHTWHHCCIRQLEETINAH